MRKAIVISDSFKGTLSSREICAIARDCFRRVLPDWQVVCVPVADGGEGTVACGGESMPVKKGESIFLPAGSGDIQVTGSLTTLVTRV